MTEELFRRVRRHVSSADGMSNLSLERLCRLSCGPDFKGVYAADCIPDGLARLARFSIVVNLATVKDAKGSLQVGHFVTVVGSGEAVRYIDPYGFPCHQPLVLRFLTLCGRSKRYSLRQVQDFKSMYCGMYALLFATHFDRGGKKKMRFFRRGKDLKKNDALCMKYLREYAAEKRV